MVKNILVLIIFFYILVLLQTSFLIHFNIWGIVPNLIFIAIILLNLIEKSENYSGLFGAAIGGFFLDIFSGGFMGVNFIGFYILISVGLAVFIKFILKKHVRIPLIKTS